MRAEIPAPPVGENHGAAIAELPSGALLACWYSGAHEEDRSVRILCSRSDADGATWSAPWTAVAPGDRAVGAAAPDKSLGNVTLTVTPRRPRLDDPRRHPEPHLPLGRRDLPQLGLRARSTRGSPTTRAAPGRTASRLVDIVGALPRAELKPVGGGYLAPFYEETAQRSAIAIVQSGRRHGAGQRRLAAATDPKLIQPALVEQNDGRFRAFFRDQQRQGVYTALFDPHTGAWSHLSITNLPNPGAAVDAFDDGAGRFVLIYNPSNANRDTLALARSADGTHFSARLRPVAPGRTPRPPILRSSAGGTAPGGRSSPPTPRADQVRPFRQRLAGKNVSRDQG